MSCIRLLQKKCSDRFGNQRKSYWDKVAQSDDFTQKTPYYGMLTFNEKKSTGKTKVEADGSTVIELYFDRQNMTLLFFNSYALCRYRKIRRWRRQDAVYRTVRILF